MLRVRVLSIALVFILPSCKRPTMTAKYAAMDAEYLHVLSRGKQCVYPKVPIVRPVAPVDSITACVVATEVMRQIQNGKGAASGMPPTYAEKITEIFVSEISSTEVPEGLMWSGFWHASAISSGRPWPFLVTFDRDTREVSMGFCGECTITPGLADSLFKKMIDSLAMDSDLRDTALGSRRGVVKPITK